MQKKINHQHEVAALSRKLTHAQLPKKLIFPRPANRRRLLSAACWQLRSCTAQEKGDGDGRQRLRARWRRCEVRADQIRERVCASAFCSAAQGELAHVDGEDDDEEGIFYSELELLDVWRRGGLG